MIYKKFIIFTDLATAQAFCDRIHLRMQARIGEPDYSADKWAEPRKHPTRNRWIVPAPHLRFLHYKKSRPRLIKFVRDSEEAMFIRGDDPRVYEFYPAPPMP